MILHLDQRMNQRGITRELVELALTHGGWDGDRCILDRRTIDQLIERCDAVRRVALRARDKGGVVVVEAGGAVLTTYNAPRRRRGRR